MENLHSGAENHYDGVEILHKGTENLQARVENLHGGLGNPYGVTEKTFHDVKFCFACNSNKY